MSARLLFIILSAVFFYAKKHSKSIWPTTVFLPINSIWPTGNPKCFRGTTELIFQSKKIKKYFINSGDILDNFKSLGDYTYNIEDNEYKVYSINFIDKFLFKGTEKGNSERFSESLPI